MDELDTLVVTTLAKFLNEIQQHRWRGRERDAISLYAFGALLEAVKPNSILYSARQIGIEVAVRQAFKDEPGRKKHKKRANKDLVIWPAPRMTSWAAQESDPVPLPCAILEWKVDSKQKSTQVNQDELKEMSDWLVEHTKGSTGPRGYGIHIQLSATGSPQPIAVLRFPLVPGLADLKSHVMAAMGPCP